MPQARPTLDELTARRGRPVYGADGDRIGQLDTIYYDYETGQPEWLGIDTGGILGGLFGSKRVVVPVEGAETPGEDEPAVRVPYSKDTVTSTPEVDSDEIPEDLERRLYAHYGLEARRLRAETQTPSEGRTEMELREEEPVGGEDEGLVRHEEEMRVGKRETTTGRVRLRKWVETAPVTEQVELRQESAHVEREPIDRPAPGARLGEDEAEMTLHGEEPVVQKETVERERVSLEPDVETRQEAVRGEVRRERVDVEGEVEEDPDLLGDEEEDDERR